MIQKRALPPFAFGRYSDGKGRTWFVLGVLALLAAGLIGRCHYRKTPAYNLRVAAPPYEEEAAGFFENNRATLTELYDRLEAMEGAGSYKYGFRYHGWDSPDIPREIRQVLAELEEQAGQLDWVEVDLYHGAWSGIQFTVADETNLGVYLRRGPDTGLTAEETDEDRVTPLEAGWEIEALYLPRGGCLF